MTDLRESLRVQIDPPFEESLANSLVEMWIEVVNAGGAVGLVPPVGRADVVAVARAAFRRVEAGEDHLVVGWGQMGEPPAEAVIGFAFLERRPGPLFRHWATVKRLQIRPSWQGRGVGTWLMEAIHEAAPRLGLEQLHLTVRGGTGAEAFYGRLGYRILARLPDAIRVAPGDDREEIYMVARL